MAQSIRVTLCPLDGGTGTNINVAGGSVPNALRKAAAACWIAARCCFTVGAWVRM